jgi:hypothetical protein
MKRSRLHVLLAAAGAGSVLLIAGCGSGSTITSPSPTPTPATTGPATAAASQQAVPAENNPPGDIPDNLAFVPYSNTAGHYTFTHPEGWLQTVKGSTATFTDKLNGVQVMPGPAAAAPTVATATGTDLPALATSQPAFEGRGVSAVTVKGWHGVRIVYRRNSAPDPVTGRQYRDEVERYELVSGGHEIVMELFGPVGADNVDAYRTMVQSLSRS